MHDMSTGIRWLQEGYSDWNDGATQCQALGGQLAILNTALRQAAAFAIKPADWSGWFGDDFYSFWVGGVLYIAIDSQYYAKAKPGAGACWRWTI